MTKTKVLFVTQEITPYLPESPMSKIGRFLPQGIQESNKEIRTFIPRYGIINERRNQLHEVIRLSGMNLIIDETDHPLIIKVASIQSARMQVYFIDNEDFFHRKFLFHDEKNNFFKDNDERCYFYSRGVLETVNKLGWPPEIVHCHGWMSALVPIFINEGYRDNPVYSYSKIILSIYNDDFVGKFKDSFLENSIGGKKFKDIMKDKTVDYVNLIKTSIDYADGIILGSNNINPEIMDYLKTKDIPILDYIEEDYIEPINNFYEQFIEE